MNDSLGQPCTPILHHTLEMLDNFGAWRIRNHILDFLTDEFTVIRARHVPSGRVGFGEN